MKSASISGGVSSSRRSSSLYTFPGSSTLRVGDFRRSHRVRRGGPGTDMTLECELRGGYYHLMGTCFSKHRLCGRRNGKWHQKTFEWTFPEFEFESTESVLRWYRSNNYDIGTKARDWSDRRAAKRNTERAWDIMETQLEDWMRTLEVTDAMIYYEEPRGKYYVGYVTGPNAIDHCRGDYLIIQHKLRGPGMVAVYMGES